MVVINTNFQSLIVQKNLNSASLGLNKTLERLSSGYKINHSADNAANYSIASKMAIQLSSHQVASENIAMGMDLVTTAQDSLSLMQAHGQRIRELITQAHNGTYGKTSLDAINSEVLSRIDEIQRIYSSTEYNGKKLLEGAQLPKWAEEIRYAARLTEEPEYNFEPDKSGFMQAVDVQNTDAMISLSSITDESTQISSGDYSIGSVEELKQFARMVNSGKITGGNFTLSNDIDLKSESNWTPIGNSNKKFKGTFNGNGHKIYNLNIESNSDYQGLFGYTESSAIIKNVGVENARITGKGNTGILVGYNKGSMTNCFAKGTVSGTDNYVGGISGRIDGDAKGCYASCTVSGKSKVGGIAGSVAGELSDCYSASNVTGTGDNVGGITGVASSVVYRCGSNSNVSASGNYSGGIVGKAEQSITDCYSKSTVFGKSQVGGITGLASGAVTNSYAMCEVSASANYVGGIAGKSSNTITNSFSESNVAGLNSNYVGGLVGEATGAIKNSYAEGNISGKAQVGGLVGKVNAVVENCYAAGTVTASSNYTGGLAGIASQSITSCYSMSDVKSAGNYVGGIAGSVNGIISKSYATGNVSGESWVGGVAGQMIFTTGTAEIDKIASVGEVNGKKKNGSLFGGIADTTDGSSFSSINITNATALSQNIKMIDFEGNANGNSYSSGQMDGWLENIAAEPLPLKTSLQVSIHGDDYSNIVFDTKAKYDLFIIKTNGAQYRRSFSIIDDFLNNLSEKCTELGSVSNRLESSLDSNYTDINNLTSSLSTFRDADIATESSNYIKMQILQQASATLLSTANQMPSIALQLL